MCRPEEQLQRDIESGAEVVASVVMRSCAQQVSVVKRGYGLEGRGKEESLTKSSTCNVM